MSSYESIIILFFLFTKLSTGGMLGKCILASIGERVELIDALLLSGQYSLFQTSLPVFFLYQTAN